MEHPQTSTTEPISTNLLFFLPPEILLLIFLFVGAENFRRDVRRLAVCKMWYAYARPMLLGDLRLRWADLRPTLRAMSNAATLAAAQQITQNVYLAMTTRSFLSRVPRASELEQLASRLKAFAALRTLVIRSRGYSLTLNSQVFSSFAAIHQLASLEVDLENVRLKHGGAHLCVSISRLIPTLKSLRCRLPRICNKLLETPPGDLKELILNISRTRALQRETFGCSNGLRVNDDRHRTALEAQLAQFAASMRNPETVRLLYRSQSPYNTYAFDAVKEQRFLLGYLPAWDARGVPLPEDWEESEHSEEGDDWAESEESEDNGDVDEELSGDEDVLEHDELDELTEDEWSEEE